LLSTGASLMPALPDVARKTPSVPPDATPHTSDIRRLHAAIGEAHAPTMIEARDLVAVVDDSTRQPRAAVRTTILDRAEGAVGKTKHGDG